MDWSNERYVRLYTRNTDDWMVWPWQARALFPLLLRAADRAGHIDTNRGVVGVAALVMLPLEVVEAGMTALTEGSGAPVVAVDRGYLIRNFMDAQEAVQTDPQRARESRARKRDRLRHGVTARDDAQRGVTERDDLVTERNTSSRDVTLASHAVTRGHSSQTSLPAPSPNGANASSKSLTKREHELAWDLWQRHCDKHDALRELFGVHGPKLLRLDTAIGYRDLVERIKGYCGDLESAEADCMHVLLFRESEARGGRNLERFGNGVWNAKLFGIALDRNAGKPKAAEAAEPEFVFPWAVEEGSA